MPFQDARALAADPSARVMVFIDGQNLYNSCKRTFGVPHCHPRLLAEHLAGPRTVNPVQVRFYTGRPDPNIEGEARKAKHLDRRLHGIRSSNVTVVLRDLRYHWDWGHRERLPAPSPEAQPQTVEMRPWQRPQEKGIDLVLGLDVVEFLLTGKCDVAIIVSLDRDLHEIPQAVRHLSGLLNRPVRLEAAVPVAKQFRTLKGFAFTHQINQRVFDLIRDDTNYAARDEDWVQPIIPMKLP